MTYEEKSHKIGRLSAIIALGLIFLVPTVISTYYQILPPIRGLLIGIGTICIVYIPISAAEFATYTPMLGTSASYLVFVTGNLTNLKIPCALMCIENAGVSPQSEEAEVIATISVASASIVTTIIVFIGMMAIAPLQPLLNSPSLQPAFNQIIPALFGAMAGYWILKQWKLAIVPIIVVVLIFMIFSLPTDMQGLLVPVMGLVSVASARIMYRKGFVC